MNHRRLIRQLEAGLATSDSIARKVWAEQIVNDFDSIDPFMALWHSDLKTAQRFMWLMGDICERKPDLVAAQMPFLFSLRDQMPFPGMPRSVAKWLWLTCVPESVEPAASQQLIQWLQSPNASIACKSFSAKAILLLVENHRASPKQFAAILENESQSRNQAYARRMKLIWERLAP